jgi:hypothetical protein
MQEVCPPTMPKLALQFGCTQFNDLGPCHNIHFLIKKMLTTKSAPPLGGKGLGPVWAFWPITSEDLKPLTPRIGPASRCKAALNPSFYPIEWSPQSCRMDLLSVWAIQQKERKEKKIYAHTLYRHDCEPVIQILNTADHVVVWGVMPLLGGGLCSLQVRNLVPF